MASALFFMFRRHPDRPARNMTERMFRLGAPRYIPCGDEHVHLTTLPMNTLSILAGASLLCAAGAFAQVPQAFNYQAVARDAVGDALVSTAIGVQFQLHQSTALGPVVYSETHATATDERGLFSLAVGTGTPGVGSFTAINWGAGPYFLEAAIDPTGGTSYVSVGTQQLLSVPYALFAESSSCFTVSQSGDTLFQGDACYVIIPGISAVNGGCADADGDGYFDQAGCGTPVDCDDSDPDVNPGAPEVCDGLDNDCNGDTDAADAGLQLELCELQSGACGGAVKPPSLCQGGAWLPCSQADYQAYSPNYEPVEVSCDGIDNNCDGQVDEGNPGGGAACNTGLLGVCAQGVLVCQGGTLVCQPINGPSPEVCDGLDNDCDGLVDEGNPGGGASCNTGLQGACAVGTLTCQNGVLTCVPTNNPTAEICDGLDNDCDGQVDEGDPGGGAACNTGLPGVCAQGVLVCVGGQLQCQPINGPSPEVCDGLDNDCDGAVDEGNPGAGAACNTGLLGACATGTLVCQGGVLTCVPNNTPTAEICDGIDNDCDGAVDEGGVCGLPDGSLCTSNPQCASGNCSGGVCCNTSCNSICTSCIGSQTGGVDGQCGFVLQFTDPNNQCFPYLCDGNGGCLTDCAGGQGCAPGYTCGPGNTCVPI